MFDVGHQCYTHKLLTGRREGFAKLRQLDGISGFPNPNESDHDAFIAGHGNTALSLGHRHGLGQEAAGGAGPCGCASSATAAFTGGMVYEGMNNIGGLDNLLVGPQRQQDVHLQKRGRAGPLPQAVCAPPAVTLMPRRTSARFLDRVPVVGHAAQGPTIQGGKSHGAPRHVPLHHV